MLRVNRLHGQDDELRTATVFTRAFGEAPGTKAVSRSRISRWETGQDRIRFEVIRRYEDLLGLQRHRLVAVSDLIYRQAASVAGPPVLARPAVAEPDELLGDTEDLLDRAFSDSVMTGTDWDVLTANLLTLKTPLLYPRKRWSELANRLVGELIIADGEAWLSRNEAARRLLALPRAGDAVIEACRALVSDPACQVVIEPLSLMDATNRPAANRHVLEQVKNPVSERALRGALLACIAKTRRRHFSSTQLQQLVGTVFELLTDPALAPDARQLGAVILRCTLAQDTDAAQARLRAAIAGDRTIRHILEFGVTLPPSPAGHVVARVAAAASTGLPGEPPAASDPMLSSLIGDLLFSPNSDVRLMAGQILCATPYRYPVGRALVAELRGRPDNGGPSPSAIVAALPQVGRPEDATVIQRLLLGRVAADPIIETAAWVSGHVRPDPGEQFFKQALYRHAGNPQKSDSVLRGLVYGAGIRRHDALLRSIHEDTEVPTVLRTATGWWLGIPDHIRVSAQTF